MSNKIHGLIVLIIVIAGFLIGVLGMNLGYRHGQEDSLGYPATENQLIPRGIYGVVSQSPQGVRPFMTIIESSSDRRQRMFLLDQHLTVGTWYEWTTNKMFVLSVPGGLPIALGPKGTNK